MNRPFTSTDTARAGGAAGGTRADTALAVLAFAAALLMTALILSQLATEASLTWLQRAQTIEGLARRLAENPLAEHGIRLSIGLNCAFIVTYVAFFAVLADRFRPMIGGWSAGIGVAGFFATALVDAIGTAHAAMMLHSIQRGLPVTVWETQFEEVLASLRYHGTYVGSALLAFGFAKEGPVGRLIAALLWFVYIPLGAVIAAYPVEHAAPLWLARFVFFVMAFLSAGLLYMRREDPRSIPYVRAQARAE